MANPDDATTARLKAALAKGNWQDVHKFLSLVEGNARGFYVNALREIAGRPAWLEDWSRAHQTSGIAWLFRGAHSIEWAWEARGGAVAAQTPQEAHQLFARRLAMAADELEQARDLEPDDPNSRACMITVNMGRSEPLHEAREYFEEAVALCPEHRFAHRNYQHRLAGRWGGDTREMLAFTTGVHHRAPAGSGLHALLPQALIDSVLDEGGNFAALEKPDHVQLLVAAYHRGPGSPHYVEDLYSLEDRNRFAFCLAYARQTALARAEFEWIGMRMTEWPWGFLKDGQKAFLGLRAEAGLK